jgi:L-lactate dehydrogenase complex protein LldG
MSPSNGTSARAAILKDVRRNLGRTAGAAPPPPPPARLRVPQVGREQRIHSMLERVAALAGKTLHARSPAEARDYVAQLTNGRASVASNERFLRDIGVTDLPGVRTGLTDETELRQTCASADFGISSATYALADTGTLVMMASNDEARLISLAPPVHIAIVPAERILTGLDELHTVVPQPADRSSSMVLITGPSRTADIEQILVRGVHGPGEIHVIVVD